MRPSRHISSRYDFWINPESFATEMGPIADRQLCSETARKRPCLASLAKAALVLTCNHGAEELPSGPHICQLTMELSLCEETGIRDQELAVTASLEPAFGRQYFIVRPLVGLKIDDETSDGKTHRIDAAVACRDWGTVEIYVAIEFDEADQCGVERRGDRPIAERHVL